MITYAIAALVIALAIAGMAIGVIVRNRQLRGSCGGLANLRDERGNVMCDVCTHPSPDCAGEPESGGSPGGSAVDEAERSAVER